MNVAKPSLNGWVDFTVRWKILEYPYGVTSLICLTTLKDFTLLERKKPTVLKWCFEKQRQVQWLVYTLSWSDRNFDKLNNGILILLNTMWDIIFQWLLYELNAKWIFGLTQVLVLETVLQCQRRGILSIIIQSKNIQHIIMHRCQIISEQIFLWITFL
jgi:hypothetical protein